MRNLSWFRRNKKFQDQNGKIQCQLWIILSITSDYYSRLWISNICYVNVLKFQLCMAIPNLLIKIQNAKKYFVKYLLYIINNIIYIQTFRIFKLGLIKNELNLVSWRNLMITIFQWGSQIVFSHRHIHWFIDIGKSCEMEIRKKSILHIHIPINKIVVHNINILLLNLNEKYIVLVFIHSDLIVDYILGEIQIFEVLNHIWLSIYLIRFC